MDSSTATFQLQSKDIKQGRPGYTPPLPLISLRKFPSDIKVCAYSYLVEYLKRTKSTRGSIDQLLITCMKPYHPVTKNTTCNWVKDVLKARGLNTGVYGAGSTRSASTSKAQGNGAPVDLIMSAAGWTRQSTFARYYNKIILPDKDMADYVLT
jgi:hypothetical protein